ncbi:MAG: hypothetical protein KJ625_08425 [Actinobacteria bacterium]|nr:hypothetical protein [Actinomycetota bacterium]
MSEPYTKEYLDLSREMTGRFFSLVEMVRGYFLLPENNNESVPPNPEDMATFHRLKHELLSSGCDAGRTGETSLDLIEAADLLTEQVSNCLSGHNKRQFIPKYYGDTPPAKEMLGTVGDLVVANQRLLRAVTGLSLGAVSKHIRKLRAAQLVEEYNRKSLSANRNNIHEKVYKLSRDGISYYRALFNKQAKYCSYDMASGMHEHHLLTNMVAYLTKGFEPMALYYGRGSEKARIKSHKEGKTTTIIPDLAGERRGLYVCIEIEDKDCDYTFREKMKKYICSGAKGVLVLVSDETLLDRYRRTIQSVKGIAKQTRTSSLWVELSTTTRFIAGEKTENILLGGKK